MEVYAVVEGDHHAHHRPALLVLVIVAEAFLAHYLLARGDFRLGIDARGVEGPEAPEVVDPRDGPDEIAVGHVRQCAQMRLVATGITDVSAGANPLPRALRMRIFAFRIEDFDAPRLEGAPAVHAIRVRVWWAAVVNRRDDAFGYRHIVAHRLCAAAVFAHEAQRGGEDGSPALARLHGARSEGPALANVLDMVEDGEGAVAGEHEVAVHAVDGEVRGDGELSGGEALGYHGAAVDAAGAGGVPEGAGVGEDVLEGKGGLACGFLGG